MKPARSRICLGCEKVFEADRRNAYHQKYCSAPDCRKASKRASQRQWLADPENRNYHSGPDAVTRVRFWQNAHPEYRARQKAKRPPALQDHCPSQAPVFEPELAIAPKLEEISAASAYPALQDFISTQPYVFIGLIAHFFNLTLQDQISSTARSLQQLGEDIANGRDPDEFVKTGHLYRTSAADTRAVQLGGSAPGAG